MDIYGEPWRDTEGCSAEAGRWFGDHTQSKDAGHWMETGQEEPRGFGSI